MKNKIDTREWKEYKIYEVFTTFNAGNKRQVLTGASIPKKYLVENGSTPRISVTGINNGIVGYYDYNLEDKSNYRVYKNFISVSFLGTIFYQEGECSLDMKVHCLKPIEKKLNKYNALYLVSALRASLKESSYSDQISSTVLPNLTIRLPKDTDENPDWDYMEQYMKFIEEHVHESLKGLNSENNNFKKVNITEWKEFPYTDFFEMITNKKKLTNKDLSDHGNTPVYSSSTFSNGIFGYTERSANYIVTEKNPIYLIFGDHTRSMFIVKENFSVMDNVKVFKTKIYNEYCLRFITTVWQKQIPNIGYARHWIIAKKTPIMLPVDKNGNPDFEFMDKYMRQIMEKEKNKLKYLELL